MKRHDFIRRSDGTSALEFALIGPLFISVIFGIFQASMVLWTQLGMEHAVEAAARCSAVNSSICGTATQIQGYALTQAYGLNLPSSGFSFNQSTCGNVVSASYSYPIFLKFFGTASIPLAAQSCFPAS